MRSTYDTKTSKLSATLRQTLNDKIAKSEVQKWAKDNKSAIKAYNDFVNENGLFADKYKTF
jgi:antitoxin CcdA